MQDEAVNDGIHHQHKVKFALYCNKSKQYLKKSKLEFSATIDTARMFDNTNQAIDCLTTIERAQNSDSVRIVEILTINHVVNPEAMDGDRVDHFLPLIQEFEALFDRDIHDLNSTEVARYHRLLRMVNHLRLPRRVPPGYK